MPRVSVLNGLDLLLTSTQAPAGVSGDAGTAQVSLAPCGNSPTEHSNCGAADDSDLAAGNGGAIHVLSESGWGWSRWKWARGKGRGALKAIFHFLGRRVWRQDG